MVRAGNPFGDSITCQQSPAPVAGVHPGLTFVAMPLRKVVASPFDARLHAPHAPTYTSLPSTATADDCQSRAAELFPMSNEYTQSQACGTCVASSPAVSAIVS